VCTSVSCVLTCGARYEELLLESAANPSTGGSSGGSTGQQQGAVRHHVPETVEYGVSSFVYRRYSAVYECVWSMACHPSCTAGGVPSMPSINSTPYSINRRGPFHADRLHEIMREGLLTQLVIRSKGLLWLWQDDRWAVDWSSAGSVIRTRYSNPYIVLGIVIHT
jgi:G3E family GTPase